MTERLDKLLSTAEKQLDKDSVMEVEAVTKPTEAPSTSEAALPPGWRVLDEDTRWKPSPIGVFVSCQ